MLLFMPSSISARRPGPLEGGLNNISNWIGTMLIHIVHTPSLVQNHNNNGLVRDCIMCIISQITRHKSSQIQLVLCCVLVVWG
jgi:hypothetical protein